MVFFVGLMPALAWAGPPEELVPNDTDPTIWGGEPVEECGWPTAVAVTGSNPCGASCTTGLPSTYS